jgi:hypothetical protein
MNKYKAKDLFIGDERVPAKQIVTNYGDYFVHFKNCHHKPKRWLSSFIQTYLSYCEVNNLDSPTNYLLLETANDTWSAISPHYFTIQDINQILDYLQKKEFIVNQLGYQLPESRPLGFLASFGKILNTKII